jgi:Zn-dependent protease with chaperone function
VAQGWLYDGTSAIRHEVRLEAAGDDLIVGYTDGDRSEIPRSRLFHVDTRGDFEVYGHAGVDGWRLGVPKGAAAELGPLLPRRRRYGRWIDRIGLWRAVAAAALISVGLVFGATRFPGWVAPFVPKSWERSIGGPILAGLEGRYCHGPGGDAALRKLARALAPEAPDLDIRVVNISMVNAAALPGDRILIFEELIRRAEGPEEVAGVLAHEIAHVENRHVTEAMVRQLSFGLIVSLFGGGTGANLETFLSTRYTRGAEEEADTDAIHALERARISPAGAAAFFGRVARQESRMGIVGRGLSYISTHPEPAERERRFRESAGSRTDWAPALTPEEWKALVAICRTDPEQNGD